MKPINMAKMKINLAMVTAGLAAIVLADAPVKAEVHGYTPKGYVRPKEPEVLERLEWFKDQKLALMMCFGLYSNVGLIESWPLSDADARWSRVEVDWTADADEFKRQYFGLIRSFNPVRIQPEKWAKAAKDGGFRYVLFTTKQHDGFCLYDTKYSDFKVTSPQCPFSTHRRADIVKHVFDAFRAEGMGIAAYFSKPDWYHADYWENHGIGRKTTRFPTYDIKKNPEKWARFREFTKNQIVEIVRDYGKVDIVWLDGGQVQRRLGLDIGIEDIIAEARRYNPALIAVDRTAGGTCENVITPEQTVPKDPIAVPWESCITIGRYWGYHFEDTYKPVRQIVHTLVDIVAKGGNLALNVGPQPDGRLPKQALERMAALGTWLKVNGEAIYETRPLAPYRAGDWAFTRNRRTRAKYAIRLWKSGEAAKGRQCVPIAAAAKFVHVGSGKSFDCAKTAIGVEFDLPDGFKADANADVFRIVECAYAPAPVVFDTPAKDERGIMVLGNGEVGATAWLDAAGVLHTVLQNSDSWNEGGRHVKTGAIDYDTKSPVDAGTYRQELSLERGEFEASWKSGGRPVSLRYRIQQGTDSIAVCDVKGASEAEARVVNWRLYPGGSKALSVHKLDNNFFGRVLAEKSSSSPPTASCRADGAM